jgi:hypothetical protein
MGKRTLRVMRSKIAAKLDELPGKQAQIVLLDGKTYAGRILSAATTGIVVEDANAAWTNLNRHQHSIRIDDIHYIALEIISAW